MLATAPPIGGTPARRRHPGARRDPV